jgi:hypothetical protein
MSYENIKLYDGFDEYGKVKIANVTTHNKEGYFWNDEIQAYVANEIYKNLSLDELKSNFFGKDSTIHVDDNNMIEELRKRFHRSWYKYPLILSEEDLENFALSKGNKDEKAFGEEIIYIVILEGNHNKLHQIQVKSLGEYNFKNGIAEKLSNSESLSYSPINENSKTNENSKFGGSSRTSGFSKKAKKSRKQRKSKKSRKQRKTKGKR